MSEWSRYTRQTGIADRVLLDDLWNTVDTELRQLAFSEVSEEQLTTEDLRGRAVLSPRDTRIEGAAAKVFESQVTNSANIKMKALT